MSEDAIMVASSLILSHCAEGGSQRRCPNTHQHQQNIIVVYRMILPCIHVPPYRQLPSLEIMMV
jgi:hypothetical protein